MRATTDSKNRKDLVKQVSPNMYCRIKNGLSVMPTRVRLPSRPTRFRYAFMSLVAEPVTRVKSKLPVRAAHRLNDHTLSR